MERAATIHLLFGMGLARDVVVSVLGCSGPGAAPAAPDDLAARLPVVLDDLERRIATMSSTRDRIAEFVAARAARPPETRRTRSEPPR